ncbi:hypothetical protein [Bradyrhizobium sp. ORS 111]|uniref:hypothetical protein n=1 Tax=Bradyrhizobium sp. ORS 111 TaxID=1685958 RepID=UPI00388D08F3
MFKDWYNVNMSNAHNRTRPNVQSRFALICGAVTAAEESGKLVNIIEDAMPGRLLMGDIRGAASRKRRAIHSPLLRWRVGDDANLDRIASTGSRECAPDDGLCEAIHCHQVALRRL